MSNERLRQLPSQDLAAVETLEVRALLAKAFAAHEHGGFTDDDWQHALGGRHFLLDVDGVIVAHAAVVERELHVDGRPLRTGYVEAVAVAPTRQGQGFGTQLMRAVNAYIGDAFELGALGTGSHHFYERLGWQTWRGPSFVRTADGLRRTPDEDGFILVLPTPQTPIIDLDTSISCDWRPGDVW